MISFYEGVMAETLKETYFVYNIVQDWRCTKIEFKRIVYIRKGSVIDTLPLSQHWTANAIKIRENAAG